MTGEPMDMPDGPGWWAFEGGLNYGNGVMLNMHIQMPVRVYWGDTTGEWQTHCQLGYHPARHLDGKWYRLHMPWEQQPAPSVSVPDEVRAAIEYALHEGWDDYNQTLPEALAHRSVLARVLNANESVL